MAVRSSCVQAGGGIIPVSFGTRAWGYASWRIKNELPVSLAHPLGAVRPRRARRPLRAGGGDAFRGRRPHRGGARCQPSRAWSRSATAGVTTAGVDAMAATISDTDIGTTIGVTAAIIAATTIRIPDSISVLAYQSTGTTPRRADTIAAAGARRMSPGATIAIGPTGPGTTPISHITAHAGSAGRPIVEQAQQGCARSAQPSDFAGKFATLDPCVNRS